MKSQKFLYFGFIKKYPIIVIGKNKNKKIAEAKTIFENPFLFFF